MSLAQEDEVAARVGVREHEAARSGHRPRTASVLDSGTRTTAPWRGPYTLTRSVARRPRRGPKAPESASACWFSSSGGPGPRPPPHPFDLGMQVVSTLSDIGANVGGPLNDVHSHFTVSGGLSVVLVVILGGLTGCSLVDSQGCPNEAHPSVRYVGASSHACSVITFICEPDDEVPFPSAETGFSAECGCGCVTSGYARTVSNRGD